MQLFSNEKFKSFLSWLVFVMAGSTILCCIVPTVFVLLGLGSVLASAFAS